MHLILGLGNPGPKYQKTRHNAGSLVVEKLLTAYGLKFTALKKCHANLTKTKIGNHDLIIAAPTTFMNESGKSVRALSDYYKISPRDIIVIYDDIDLPLGAIRIRENGSAGGHRGMQSIIEQLGTEEFPRIRIGIGPQPEKVPSEKYVLQNFKKDEWKILQDEIIPKTIRAIKKIFEEGIGNVMNAYNDSRDT